MRGRVPRARARRPPSGWEAAREGAPDPPVPLLALPQLQADRASPQGLGTRLGAAGIVSAAAGPTLSVVVPATDEPPTLARCTAAISARLADADELIVVTEPHGAGP